MAITINNLTYQSKSSGNLEGIWENPQFFPYALVVVGNQVTLDFWGVSDTQNTSGIIVSDFAIPANLRPSALVSFPVLITDNTNVLWSRMSIDSSDGIIRIYGTPAGGNFSGTGTGTLNNGTVSWTTVNYA